MEECRKAFDYIKEKIVFFETMGYPRLEEFNFYEPGAYSGFGNLTESNKNPLVGLLFCQRLKASASGKAEGLEKIDMINSMIKHRNQFLRSSKKKGSPNHMRELWWFCGHVNCMGKFMTLTMYPYIVIQRLIEFVKIKGIGYKTQASPNAFVNFILSTDAWEGAGNNPRQVEGKFSIALTQNFLNNQIMQSFIRSNVESFECHGYLDVNAILQPERLRPPPAPKAPARLDPSAVANVEKHVERLKCVPVSEAAARHDHFKGLIQALEGMSSDQVLMSITYPRFVLKSMLEAWLASTGKDEIKRESSEDNKVLMGLMNRLCALRLRHMEQGAFPPLTEEVDAYLRAAAVRALHGKHTGSVGEFAASVARLYPRAKILDKGVSLFAEIEKFVSEYGGYLQPEDPPGAPGAVADGPRLAEEVLALAKAERGPCTDPPTEAQRSHAHKLVVLFYRALNDPALGFGTSLDGVRLLFRVASEARHRPFASSQLVFETLAYLGTKHADSVQLRGELDSFAGEYLSLLCDENRGRLYQPTPARSEAFEAALKAVRAEASKAAKRPKKQ